MRKITKKVLSIMLVLAMVLEGGLPVSASGTSFDGVFLTFESDEEIANFSNTSGWSIVHEAESGVLKAGATWSANYLTQALPMNENLSVSFDFYIEQDSTSNYSFLSFGFMNASQTEGTMAWLRRDDAGDLLTWGKNNIGGPYNGWKLDNILCSASSTEFIDGGMFGSKHSVTILVQNGVLTTSVDGNTLSNAVSATEQISCDLDEAYFTILSTNTTAYIDNLHITKMISSEEEEVEINITLDYGDTKSIYSESVTFSMNANSGNRRCWLGWGTTGDWEGAEYFVMTVSNPSESDDAGLKMEFYENSSQGYGIPWYVAEGTEYFLSVSADNSSKVRMRTTALDKTNCGLITIPAGFEGQVLIPITSLEHSGWLLPAGESTTFGKYAEMYERYGEPNVVHLTKFAFYDIYYVTTNSSSTDTFTISNTEIWGSYIPSVISTYKTVIQAIENIGTVTAASENQILFAQDLYTKLSDEEKAQVTNYVDLQAAISNYAILADYSGYVGTKGKNFIGTEGISMSKTLEQSPSTISAWIKVAEDISDDTHIGTIIGNMERTGGSQYVFDASRTMSMEITTHGNPKFTWRCSESEKVTFVVRNVDVRIGEWMNLAFVRDVDNSEIHCYVNGIKVATKQVTQTEIADIAFAKKPLLIGSDYTNDEVMAPGYTPDFNGSIANLRMYGNVLTEEQMLANLTDSVADAELMHEIDLSEGDTTYYDNSQNATLENASGWILDGGEKLAQADYSIAVLPDTQMLLSRAKDDSGNDLYTEEYDETSNVFYQNINWLIQNKEDLKLQYVLHVGDLTDNGNNSLYATKGVKEYEYGLKWMDMLRANGIPYALARGNHDSNFDSHYTVDAYGTYADAGLQTDTTMENAAYTFVVGSQKYLVIVLDVEPSDEAIAWANEVVEEKEDYRTIIMTHAYLDKYGERFQSSTLYGTNYGEKIWEELASQHKNIFMVLCGHDSGTDIVRTTDIGVNGNTVHQIMIDESILGYYGKTQMGVIALMSFSNGGNTIEFNYYSPSSDMLYRGGNQFIIQLDETIFGDNTKTEYKTQAELADTSIPVTTTHSWKKASGDWFTTEDSSGGEFAHNGMTLREYIMTSVSYNITEDGIFYFAEDAYLSDSTKIQLKVSVTDYKTRAKQVFPRDGSEYYIGSETKYMLDDIGGIEVKAGDSIVVSFTSNSGNVWASGKFTGSVTRDSVAVQEFTMIAGSAAYGNATAKAECDAVFEGTKTDYSIGYTDIITSQSGTLTIVDSDEQILEEIIIARRGLYRYYLSELERSGKSFIGYMIEGNLYPAGTELKYNAQSTTVTAIFADFAMFNSASVRMDEPTGLRFSTQLDCFTYLAEQEITFQLGTLIAKASDISSGDAIDYEKLTTNAAVAKLNIVSTVQVNAPNGYTQFNAAVVNLAERLYPEEFAARAYMTITYADGSTETVYAKVSDNTRSVTDVATMALADTKVLQTTGYPYEADNGFSPYPYEQRTILRKFIGDVLVARVNDDAFEDISVPYQEQGEVYTVYVSPNGDNANAGTTLDSAVASLEQAQSLIQNYVAEDGSKDSQILLDDGEYFLENTLAFTNKDVANGKKLYIRSMNPNQAILTGSKQVDAESIVEVSDSEYGRMWIIPCAQQINQLYVNNSYVIRARYPDAGEELRLLNWDTTMRNIIIDSADIADFTQEDFAGSTLVANVMWAESYLRISKVEDIADISHVYLIGADQGVFLRRQPELQARQSYHFENSKAFLSTSGEWYYSAEESCVYYLPYEYETLKNTTIRIPYTEELLTISGNAENPVTDISIEGLNFKWTANGHVDGKIGNQANKDDGSNRRFVDTANEGRPVSAISISYAKNVTISGNIFANMGGGAIDFVEGVQNSSIEKNMFQGIGGSGVFAGAIAYETDNVSVDESCYIRNVTVENNYFNDICWQEYGGCAVVFNYAVDSLISHNTIRNTKYSGISVGWGWLHDALPYLQNNEISYNKLTNTMSLMSDGGAIYMVGCQPNSTIKNNYIDNMYNSVYKFPEDLGTDASNIKWWSNAGIYLDEGVGGTSDLDIVKVSDNVVSENVESNAYHLNNAGSYYELTEPKADDQNDIISEAGVQENEYILLPRTAVLFGSRTDSMTQSSLYGTNLGTQDEGQLIIKGVDGKFTKVSDDQIVSWTNEKIVFQTTQYLSGDIYIYYIGGYTSNKITLTCNVDQNYCMYQRFEEDWGGLDGLAGLLTTTQALKADGYTCSSELEAYPASAIGDQDPSTGWSCAEEDTNQWVGFELQQVSSVNKILLYARAGLDQPECRQQFHIYGVDEQGTEYLIYEAGNEESFEAGGVLIVDVSQTEYKNTVFKGFRIARPEDTNLYFFVADVAVV